MSKLTNQLWIATGVSLCCLATTSLSQAQVTSDGTVSTDVTTSDNLNFTITGGGRAAGNLFHSFDQFSVPNRGSARFNNALDVQNIISRVTGGSVSNIDGLIQAQGSANLFLINPNGIIFGPEARLNIGGSFLASTASRLNFADNTFFSATDPQAQPLLTMSVPVGLQFGETAGSVVNQSQATRFFPDFDLEVPVGLEVQSGKTLALVGGDVFLEGGRMLAPGGRIELGSVAGPSLVSLTPIAAGWALGYEGVQNFQNMQLSQASVNTGGESLGDMQLRGRQIAITDGSEVGGINFGVNPGGTLSVKAAESVEVSGSSSLNTATVSTGAAGDITIATRQLIVREGSFIDTPSGGEGQGGNLTVDASESVEVNGGGGLSALSTQTFGSGDAGELQVTTGRLILRDGGQISSSTRDIGNGGAVFVDASESVEASGQGKTSNGTVVKSGLFAETTGPVAVGDGGVLSINTERLVVQEGASLSVAADEGSTGQAGGLNIHASGSVVVSGIGSTLLAESESSQPAGDLTITTRDLIVRDGAAVSLSGKGSGIAGNLKVTADSILLDAGTLTAETALGEGGNIMLQQLNLLQLSRNSEISTNAGGSGNGGDIKIDTDLLVALEDSDIVAQAVEGRGGNIQITTQGLFRSPDSEIDASSERGIDGVVEFIAPDVDPDKQVVNLPEGVVDASGLIAQICPAGEGAVARSSEFVVTGRSGLPPTPSEVLKGDTALVDLGTTIVSSTELPSGRSSVTSGRAASKEPLGRIQGRTDRSVSTNPTNSAAVPITEAQGWVKRPDGEVMLTAQAPAVTPHSPGQTPTACHGS